MSCRPSQETAPTPPLSAGAGRWWNTFGSLPTKNSLQLPLWHSREGRNLPRSVIIAGRRDFVCWRSRWATEVRWLLMEKVMRCGPRSSLPTLQPETTRPASTVIQWNVSQFSYWAGYKNTFKMDFQQLIVPSLVPKHYYSSHHEKVFFSSLMEFPKVT